uniref:Ubiquitin-like domain-containing protein n=1 Tax=Panagrellus redivivus TaxID=6233 RepID=A0A7E4V552_PANRE
MSSDEDCNIYSNFKKYRQKIKKSIVIEKPKVVKSTPKKVIKKKRASDSSSDSEEDLAVSIQRHLAEKAERERKAAKKPKRDDIWDEYDKEYGTVNGESVEPIHVPAVGLSPSVQKMLADLKQDEMQEKFERARFEAQLANAERQREMELSQMDQEKYIFITLTVMGRSEADFNEHAKLDYDKQFADILIKYAPMAGWSNPNDVDLLWDKPEQLVTLKFYETPKQHDMPAFKYAKLIMVGKDGAQAEVRTKGDIKLKINLASQRKPLEKIIMKNSTFGDLKKELEKDLKVPPSKMKIVFDAEVVEDSQTPDELDMEEADVIDLQIVS